MMLRVNRRLHPDPSKSLARWMLTTLLVVAASSAGCKAKLETECVTGDNCGDYAPEPGVQNIGDCLETCDQLQATGVTGEFPCGVQAIMDDICTDCHGDPLTNSAPFPLVEYADTQVLAGSRVVYSVIVSVVGLEDDPVDFMPFQRPPLDSEQRKALLDDWACVCAPPRPDGEMCE